ncbi:putative aminopeptidase [Methylohalomonas lacus]|uniref:Aminopeptidase n=1 Tax=Methylohalomonas lacus TaxID=398773 RepID=A0AAE3HNE4_9GAMM|nr:aminopeptidase [Methylohalomonas lacus]MCS3903658.1 putative aminopeptidase [Methylohalomonas lacus]
MAALLSGCGSISYYGQAISGHLDVMQRRQPITTLLADPDTPAPLRERLQTALAIRRFASTELGLPDNASYRSYADLERDFVVWNVIATPPLSLEPREWCFLLVGCLQYRGYYSAAEARRFAQTQSDNGDDVFVGGVTAYSTLGWFDDPVLNTMLKESDARLAQVIFHELAHQQLFIKGDTEFNEAFADSIGITGTRRWLSASGRHDQLDRYEQQRAQEERVIELIMTTRTRLERIYTSDRSDATKRARKQAEIARLRRDYKRLSAAKWPDQSRFDAWFAADINNASLAAVATYRELVPDFLRLQAALDHDLDRFFASVAELATCSQNERREWLKRRKPTGDCRVRLANSAASR